MESSRDIALVTGSSSGIGAEMARVLARRGVDLVITARRKDRLTALKEELESRWEINVTQIENDLNAPHGAERLYQKIQRLELPVSILINNAGLGFYNRVVDQEVAQIDRLIQVNIVALTRLTRLFAADMLARGRGYVLNVSSFAALQPIPRYAVYSGAKSYVVAFSRTLRYELRRQGVRVSVLCPGFTTTEFHAVAQHSRTALMRLTSLNPRHVAEAGIRGMFRGKTIIVPGVWYKFSALLGRFLPSSLACAMAAKSVKS